LKTLYPVGIDHHDLLDSDAVGEPGEPTREELLDALIKDAERAYAEREKQLEEIAGDGAMRQLERNVLLNVLDRKWREHLYEMDYLKEGIGLRAMAQRDPLVEYKREGFEMFSALLEGLKEESVTFLFNVQVQVTAPEVPAEPAPAAVAAAAPGSALSQIDGQAGEGAAAPALAGMGGMAAPEARPLTYTGPAEDGGEVQTRGDGGAAAAEPSRNAPCPCGSGRKYKRCHGAPTTAHS
jgi:preprotein translocase subunit SecA